MNPNPLFPDSSVHGAMSGLEDLYIVTSGLAVAIPYDAPEQVRLNVAAAALAPQLGIKSVDYLRKQYAEIWSERRVTFSARHRYALATTAQAKAWVAEAIERLKAVPDKPDHVGLFASGAALLRLTMTFRCATFCVRNGFHFEFAVLARLILEQLAWVLAIYTVPDGEALAIQPQSCVGRLKPLFPYLGPLYGHLSASGHITPRRTTRYIDFSEPGDPGIVLTSDRYAAEDAFDLLALADAYVVICEWIYADRYRALLHVDLDSSGQKTPKPDRPTFVSLQSRAEEHDALAASSPGAGDTGEPVRCPARLIGDTSFSADGLHLPGVAAAVAVGVRDLERALVEAAQDERPERHVPHASIDLFEAHVLLREHVADVDPRVVPAHAAVAAHAPHLPMGGVLDRGQAARVGPRRRRVQRRRRPLA